MRKYAQYLESVEIPHLWSDGGHIRWTLDPKVNVLSGINGVGKTTILHHLIGALSPDGALPVTPHGGITLKAFPEDATHVRFDVIRSFDRPLVSKEVAQHLHPSIVTELDFRLYQLQRRFLDYQVNLGNRMIRLLQQPDGDNARLARALVEPKTRFQDIVDSLFAETGKTIIRSENEISFNRMGQVISPYSLSAGEKQLLVILLTVLIEDAQPYVLLMDEPEISMHIDWQKTLISHILALNPNLQIILTTHSPAVIMDGWMDRVTEVTDICCD